VHHLTFGALHEARAHYDLVVLGTGGSLYRPLLAEEVLDLVGRSRAAIGIFGTQYRGLIPRAGLQRLIDRLDCWFARYQDDALLYGRGRNNVDHLGDWLIDFFPLTEASDAEALAIGVEAEAPAIEEIQRHKRVFSAQAAPLLCALTAAETAGYADVPSSAAPGIASGTFRSMLIDIFGRSYPERQFFLVDREAVSRYKAGVHRNVATLRRRIDGILRNVAVAG